MLLRPVWRLSLRRVPLSPRDRTMSTKLLRTTPSTVSFSIGRLEAPPVVADSATDAALDEAADLLRAGQVVAFPTETVYGLAADALNGEAVLKIFAAKGRPSDNPLIVHVSSPAQLSLLLPNDYTPPPLYQHLMRTLWPGPLTLLFPSSSAVPAQTTASLSTVGVRMPSHPLARALIHKAGTPLAAPSANASGRPSPTRASHVLHDLAGRIPAVLDGGECSVGLESTVVDGLNDDGHLRILRPGGVTREQLEQAIIDFEGPSTGRRVISGEEGLRKGEREKPRTPGMKYKHYTPTIPVHLFCPRKRDGDHLVEALTRLVDRYSTSATASPKVGLMAYTPSQLALPESIQIDFVRHPLGDRSNPEEAARRLFDGFLSLEAEGCVCIIIEEGAELDGVGVAVAERVKKAVGKDGSVLIQI